MTRRFSASSAAQLMSCHGSANLELAIPGFVEPVKDDVTRNAKNIGTTVHEILEPLATMNTGTILLYGRAIHAFQAVDWRKRYELDTDTEMSKWLFLTKIGPHAYSDVDLIDWLLKVNEARLTPKMMRYVFDVTLKLVEILGEFSASKPLSKILTEDKLNCSWLDSDPTTTVDVAFVAIHKLIVVDYKSGSLPVDPVENDQLLFYAASAVWSHYLMSELPDDFVIELWVMQPGNLESWATTLGYVRQWMNRARRTDKAIIGKDLQLRVSDHCTFCPANPRGRGDKGNKFCPEMLQLLYPSPVDEDEIFS